MKADTHRRVTPINMRSFFLTLVVGESTLLTLPCQGRDTCSGGPRGPPGAGPMVAYVTPH
eukprot:scaffold98602_cov36-Phaeocystis_antarctica.AAC.1